ncbi:hypothetical protein PUR71_10385 [Streptomyces sp. SP17BM10]|uniref:hypothetical protein n=1 Tax=Streptomyces sp. SP17BM10 TaxID=3002530 RepID=UPI002E79AF54|nr:hypothetical protein [Streptomyces sp. SP17BM10]MEE1783318.1 hypothetical protein [Streptomyces sp. SP17BM10]
MAHTSTGWQAVPARPAGGARSWPWLVLGMAEFLAAGTMLAQFVVVGLMAGVMGLAAGSSVGAVAGLIAMLAAGPLAGLLVAGLGAALIPARVRRRNGAAVFPLLMAGLLAGTAVEYFGWIHPALH